MPALINMQYLTIALAFAGLAASTPVPAELETRATYQWSVTKWMYSRGQSAYDYSFTVQGPKSGNTPGFIALCDGVNVGGYAPCTIQAHQGTYLPNVSANVNNVVDPTDPNDTIPKVLVKLSYTDDNDCTYTQIGNHDASLNSGSGPASKFVIVPSKARAVC